MQEVVEFGDGLEDVVSVFEVHEHQAEEERKDLEVFQDISEVKARIHLIALLNNARSVELGILQGVAHLGFVPKHEASIDALHQQEVGEKSLLVLVVLEAEVLAHPAHQPGLYNCVQGDKHGARSVKDHLAAFVCVSFVEQSENTNGEQRKDVNWVQKLDEPLVALVPVLGPAAVVYLRIVDVEGDLANCERSLVPHHVEDKSVFEGWECQESHKCYHGGPTQTLVLIRKRWGVAAVSFV